MKAEETEIILGKPHPKTISGNMRVALVLAVCAAFAAAQGAAIVVNCTDLAISAAQCAQNLGPNAMFHETCCDPVTALFESCGGVESVYQNRFFLPDGQQPAILAAAAMECRSECHV